MITIAFVLSVSLVQLLIDFKKLAFDDLVIFLLVALRQLRDGVAQGRQQLISQQLGGEAAVVTVTNSKRTDLIIVIGSTNAVKLFTESHRNSLVGVVQFSFIEMTTSSFLEDRVADLREWNVILAKDIEGFP